MEHYRVVALTLYEKLARDKFYAHCSNTVGFFTPILFELRQIIHQWIT